MLNKHFPNIKAFILMKFCNVKKKKGLLCQAEFSTFQAEPSLFHYFQAAKLFPPANTASPPPSPPSSLPCTLFLAVAREADFNLWVRGRLYLGRVYCSLSVANMPAADACRPAKPQPRCLLLARPPPPPSMLPAVIRGAMSRFQQRGSLDRLGSDKNPPEMNFLRRHRRQRDGQSGGYEWSPHARVFFT